MVIIFEGVERLAAAFGVEEDEDGIAITTAREAANAPAPQGLRPPKQLGERPPAQHWGLKAAGGTANGDGGSGVPCSQTAGLLPQKERRGSGRGVLWNSAGRRAFDGVPFACIGLGGIIRCKMQVPMQD
mmetsp:Transcript_87947/g.273347  ORF Transcript_87947/g.273347 Transcript_87947/m.273347 type:complete len:129 (+) Transcript_87947:795-1181(+)